LVCSAGTVRTAFYH